MSKRNNLRRKYSSRKKINKRFKVGKRLKGGTRLKKRKQFKKSKKYRNGKYNSKIGTRKRNSRIISINKVRGGSANSAPLITEDQIGIIIGKLRTNDYIKFFQKTGEIVPTVVGDDQKAEVINTPTELKMEKEIMMNMKAV